MWRYINAEHLYELHHHGIKGMKWGVKNGPPYPLNPKNTKHLNKQDDTKKHMLGGIEDVITATAALTITAAAVYAKRTSVKRQTEKILKTLEKTDIIGLSDLPKIKSAHTIESDLTAVNPKFSKGTDYQMNCAYCTATYELRRRGFDVEVLPRPIPTSEKDVEAMYKSAKFQTLKETDKLSEIAKEAEKWGNNTRGVVAAYFGPGVGHIFSVEVRNGKALFVDPQTGSKIQDGKISYLAPETGRPETCDLANKMTMGKFFRTDNLELSNKILKTSKKRKV